MRRGAKEGWGEAVPARRVHRLGLKVLLAGATVLACGDAPTVGSEAEVRSVVQAYFDGLMQGSAESLDRAFHPGARLIGMRGLGTLAIIPYHEWRDVLSEDGPRGPEGYRNEILSVDIHGVAATVKTKLTWPEVVYVDYLSLVRADGEWKIVNKIWDAEPTTPADTLSG